MDKASTTSGGGALLKRSAVEEIKEKALQVTTGSTCPSGNSTFFFHRECRPVQIVAQTTNQRAADAMLEAQPEGDYRHLAWGATESRFL